ncbi:HypC/HybG/HupF family hydrogenase formation chaperone [Vibrio sonorensis]|uniref:HypC/HybG/HupF family hydrogenase formation chaperone n=1 Tax=Vibrio sonorensis TaxID=1004316 RepID=UPI0008DA1AB4|nr:HypC/HybG/HupF family hydrogenase formation chaperone [Vibrio sonorensis]
MCLGVPAQVVSVSNNTLTATVRQRGQTFTVNLTLLDKQVNQGDYLLIQLGGFACEILPQQQALEAIAIIDAIKNGDMSRAKHLYS